MSDFHIRLFYNYYFKKLNELEEREDDIIRQIRQKRNVYILCDELRVIAIKKAVIMGMYDDLRPFLTG